MIAIPGWWCFEVGLSILRIDLEALVACGTGHWPVVLVHQVRGSYSGVELKMSRRQGGPSRTGGKEGAYLHRYVTDEQRSRRLIFSSTPWAVQHWRFWGVARSTRISLDTDLRSRLPKSPTLRRRRYTRLGLGAPGGTRIISADCI
jgi:hypothetical protein